MTKKKEKENSFGQTAENTTDNGKMVNNMAKECLQTETANNTLENGVKDKKYLNELCI